MTNWTTRRPMYGTFSIILILILPVLGIRHAFASGIFEDGFEGGNFSKWSRVIGSPSITSGDTHDGIYKAVFNASDQFAQAMFAGAKEIFMRAYVMFRSFPPAGTETTVLGVYNYANGRYMAEARIGDFAGTTKWRLRYYDNGTYYTVTSEQQKPILDRWYCVEVGGKSNTTTNAESRIYIDGNELTDISQTGRNNDLPITCGYIWANSAATRWYDCIVIDSSYIGPETTHQTVHDVGIISILTSKCGSEPFPTVGQGYGVRINITVANEGDAFEVFNVTLYANEFIIGKQQVALDSAEISTICFVWESSGWELGNYTIGASADVVPGEAYTADNTLIGCSIFVTLPGDIDGNRRVDIFDVVTMASRYGVKSTSTEYCPNCDIDDDGDIDNIDIYDIVIASGNYAKSW